MAEIPDEIEEVRAARVQPGDIIIARLKEPVSMETQEMVYNDLCSIWPLNKVLVLDPNLEIELHRPAEGLTPAPSSPLGSPE